MAARSVGSLFIDIEARTARLEADLGKANNLLKKLGAQTAVMSRGFNSAFSLAKSAVAAFASIQAIKALKTMALGTLEAMNAQMALAEQSKLSVDDITAYSEASEHLGVTNLNLAKTMKELFALQSDARAGNKLATQQVRQMGMTVEDFGALKPAELFESVVESMSKIPDVATRSALAQKVFGKEAMNLGVLLQQGSKAIKESRAEMERLGQTTSNFDTARVTIALQAVAELDDRWEVFKKRLAIGLTPLIYTASQRLADLLGSIDIEKLAKTISHWALAIAGFILTIPERFSLMLKDVQLMWYDFIAQFDTGDSAGFLGKMFGTQSDNKAKIEEIKGQVASLKASIVTMSGTLEEEFNSKVEAILTKIATLPPVVSSVNTGISSGLKEMVDAFSASFQKVADISGAFIDGESIKFGDFLRDLVKTIVSTFLKVSLINPLLNSLFGGMMGGTAGGWWNALPAMFGGGKARGGPVVAGDSALVGEDGPEVVNFGRSGTVIPTDRMMNRSGGSGGGVHFSFMQTFSSGLQKTELAAIVPQIVQQSKAAVADAFMRGGGFRRAMAY